MGETIILSTRLNISKFLYLCDELGKLESFYRTSPNFGYERENDLEFG